MRHCRLIETEKSAIADHMWGQNQKILFNETQLLSNVTHYSTRIYREAIEIHKHKKSFNKKEESLKISDTWLPALRKTVKKQTIKDIKAATDPIAIHL